MVCVRYPPSLRQVENILHERNIGTLQEFAAIHAVADTQFNLERHIPNAAELWAGKVPSSDWEWWARQDSNLQHDRYERPVLTS
jgi:hypothetical protein